MTSVGVPGGDAPVVFVPRSDVLRGWFDDWDRWRSGPDAVAGLGRWSADPLLAAYTSSVAVLVGACGRDVAVPEAAADVRLAALARFAVGGDLAVVRVVLERLVPTLVTRAGVRARRTGAPFGAVFADLAGAGWLVVRTYPLERYPDRLALRMVARAVYRVWGYLPVVEQHSVPLEAAPPRLARLDGGAWDGEGSSPAAELVDVLTAAAAAGAPGPALRLVAELGVAGRSPVELASRDGVSDRTVRNRRAAAVAAVRAAVLGATPAGSTTGSAAGSAA